MSAVSQMIPPSPVRSMSAVPAFRLDRRRPAVRRHRRTRQRAGAAHARNPCTGRRRGGAGRARRHHCRAAGEHLDQAGRAARHGTRRRPRVQPRRRSRPRSDRRLDARPLRGGTTPAALCATCGTVEAVTRAGKGRRHRHGAVAGGVLGGVVGHQVGGGNGKTAMTVIGAIGGGLAGHEVEKRVRSETRYDVRRAHGRRQHAGSSARRSRSRSAPGVVAEGGALRIARESAHADEPRMVRTSSSTPGGRT